MRDMGLVKDMIHELNIAKERVVKALVEVPQEQKGFVEKRVDRIQQGIDLLKLFVDVGEVSFGNQEMPSVQKKVEMESVQA